MVGSAGKLTCVTKDAKTSMEKDRVAPIPPALKGIRAIVHIDLDAFYCQVEQNRLELDSNLAVCVQQWQGLIAVNYPARALGIKRHATVSDALQLAREKNAPIRFVHVATYAPGETEPKHHESERVSSATHKVSLEPYRRASKKIFQVFAKFTSHIQKASVDEGYLDLTENANRLIAEDLAAGKIDGAEEEEGPIVEWDDFSILVSNKPQPLVTPPNPSSDSEPSPVTPVDPLPAQPSALASTSESSDLPTTNPPYDEISSPPPHPRTPSPYPEAPNTRTVSRGWGDLQLCYAAKIAKQIRTAVWDELHYTCSAGISHNKMLSKLCSGLNKPNKQTVLRETLVTQFMRELPFTKIRMLGGKLGHEVEEQLSVEKAGDLWKFPLAHLQKLFGVQMGLWLHDIVRGVSTEEVKEVTKTKSFMSAKSLRPPVKDMSEYRHWFGILAAELYVRLQDDWEDNGRWPKTMVISLRTPHLDKSRSHPFPPRSNTFTADTLVHRAMDLLKQEDHNKIFPCFRLSMQVTGLQGEKGTGDITKWMKSAEQGDSARGVLPAPTTVVRPSLPPAKPKGLMAFFSSATDARPAMSPSGDVDRNDDGTAPSDTEAGSAVAEEILESMREDETDDDDDGGSGAGTGEGGSDAVDVDALIPEPRSVSTYVCDNCGETVPETSRGEHTDWHFAVRLSHEERKSSVLRGGLSQSSPGAMGTRGKRKSLGNRGTQGGTIPKRAKGEERPTGTLKQFFGTGAK